MMYPPPPPATFAPPSIPPQQRQSILSQQVASMVTMQGCRVESEGQFQAVLVSGRPVNHTLHAVGFVLTCGMWMIPWMIFAMTGGVRRDLVQVNEWGYLSVQRISGPAFGG
jgi:hypothetical protein